MFPFALLAALWRPSGRPFQVTAKGLANQQVVVQWGLMAPFALLFALTV